MKIILFLICLPMLALISCNSPTTSTVEVAGVPRTIDDNSGSDSGTNSDGENNDSTGTGATGNEENSDVPDEFTLVDIAGKKWDIAYALKNYGFKKENFQYGIGIKAIQPILDPTFYNPGDQGYPSPDKTSLIIGFSLHDITRAYPITVMSRHEVIDEIYQDEHVAIAYCPLVKLAGVYRREINGQVLTLAASGWTYNFTFVLYDHETESLWYPLPGTSGLTCINGRFADSVLPELPSFFTRWNHWFDEHRDSQFLIEPIRP